MQKAETYIKDKFECLLKTAFPEATITRRRTTDFVVKLNGQQSYYFELKTTTDSVLKKNRHYFGAISGNQWTEAIKNEDCYYFVLAVVDEKSEECHYLLFTPNQMFDYVTSIDFHTKILVPSTTIEKYSLKENLLYKRLKEHSLVENLQCKDDSYKSVWKSLSEKISIFNNNIKLFFQKFSKKGTNTSL